MVQWTNPKKRSILFSGSLASSSSFHLLARLLFRSPAHWLVGVEVVFVREGLLVRVRTSGFWFLLKEGACVYLTVFLLRLHLPLFLSASVCHLLWREVFLFSSADSHVVFPSSCLSFPFHALPLSSCWNICLWSICSVLHCTALRLWEKKTIWTNGCLEHKTRT